MIVSAHTLVRKPFHTLELNFQTHKKNNLTRANDSVSRKAHVTLTIERANSIRAISIDMAII